LPSCDSPTRQVLHLPARALSDPSRPSYQIKTHPPGPCCCGPYLSSTLCTGFNRRRPARCCFQEADLPVVSQLTIPSPWSKTCSPSLFSSSSSERRSRPALSSPSCWPSSSNNSAQTKTKACTRSSRSRFVLFHVPSPPDARGHPMALQGKRASFSSDTH